MTSPFIQKLEHSGFLTAEDRHTLLAVPIHKRHVPKHTDLIREGDRPESVFVVVEGFACRYKLMPRGRRHIMALLLPGDICDLHITLLAHMDHGIATLSACEIADISRRTVEDLTDNHRNITRALWWASLTDEGTLREWLANMGQRDANRQMAHLFCELLVRLQAVGRATHDGYDFPVKQTDLGDILGLSTVHVNRSLQLLRREGLLSLRSGRLRIANVERLMAFCDFNPNYLHLRPRDNQRLSGTIEGRPQTPDVPPGTAADRRPG